MSICAPLQAADGAATAAELVQTAGDTFEAAGFGPVYYQPLSGVITEP